MLEKKLIVILTKVKIIALVREPVIKLVFQVIKLYNTL